MKYILSQPVWLAIIFTCAATIEAHTWLEQLTVVAPNGTFIGNPGYPRGFVARLPGVDPDEGMTYLLPPNGRSTGNEILQTDLMCKSTQTIGSQTAGSPALIASPGDFIALRYQENGHVTQPQIPPGKPEGSGIVYVYGTASPSNDDTYLGIHHVWNADGTGGDGRGVLLATRHFDDGQCYQINNGTISKNRQEEFPHNANPLMGEDLWCQTDVQLPADATGNYTLYWVWDWPTLDSNGAVIKNESYTTCSDISLTPAEGKSSKAEVINFAKGQSLDSAAISVQLETPFIVDPTAAQQVYTNGPAAAIPSSAPAQSSSATPTSKAAGGFVTVTVTGDPKTQLETVTATVFNIVGHIVATSDPVQPGSSQVMSTVTISPLPLSSPTSTNTSPSSLQSTISSAATTPAIQPFLSPESKIISVNSISSASSSSPIKSPTIPSAPTTETLTSASPTRILTPTIPSSITLPGGVFRLRGRVFRR